MSIMKARQHYIIVKEEADRLWHQGILTNDEHKKIVVTLFHHYFMRVYKPSYSMLPGQIMTGGQSAWSAQTRWTSRPRGDYGRPYGK
jgi:hypothetical protein